MGSLSQAEMMTGMSSYFCIPHMPKTLFNEVRAQIFILYLATGIQNISDLCNSHQGLKIKDTPFGQESFSLGHFKSCDIYSTSSKIFGVDYIEDITLYLKSYIENNISQRGLVQTSSPWSSFYEIYTPFSERSVSFQTRKFLDGEPEN